MCVCVCVGGGGGLACVFLCKCTCIVCGCVCLCVRVCGRTMCYVDGPCVDSNFAIRFEISFVAENWFPGFWASFLQRCLLWLIAASQLDCSLPYRPKQRCSQLKQTVKRWKGAKFLSFFFSFVVVDKLHYKVFTAEYAGVELLDLKMGKVTYAPPPMNGESASWVSRVHFQFANLPQVVHADSGWALIGVTTAIWFLVHVCSAFQFPEQFHPSKHIFNSSNSSKK